MPNTVPDIIELFEEKALPQFTNISGCLFAALLKNNLSPNVFAALTFWETNEQAENFESSDVYKNIITQLNEATSHSKELKAQLSENLVLEYFPVEEEPRLNFYKVTQTSSGHFEKLELPRLFVRLVSVKIEIDKFQEFKNIYEDEIIPELQSTPGCYSAYMLENIKEKNSVMLINIWENEESAGKYEEGKLFKKHFQKVEHTFSQLYQWKLVLEESYSGKIKTSDDLQITHYTLVAGKIFN